MRACPEVVLGLTLAISLMEPSACVDLENIPTNNATEATTASTTTTTTTTVAPEPAKREKSFRQLLRQHLLNGTNAYDKEAHPRLNHSETVLVSLGMAVIHYDIDEARSVFLVDAWMRMSWHDDHMKWDPSEFGGLKQIHMGSQEIWRPDILLYNNADPTLRQPYGNAHFVVESDGTILWVPPAHLEGFCKLKLRFWPLDGQTCKLKFGSWTSHGDQIALAKYRNMTTVEFLNFYTKNREWQSLGTTVDMQKVTYDCCDESYPDMTFTFQLQRSSPAYRALMVLPCLVIMLMTVCCFLLPPMAGEKVTVNGFAFVSAVMYLIYFSHTLPFHETEVPILVMFFSNTTAMIGIGLLLNVVAISMSRERKFQGPPKFLKSLFSGTLGRCLCLGNYYHQVSATHQRLVLELSDLHAESTDCGEDEQGSATASNGGVSTVGGGGGRGTFDPDFVRHGSGGLTHSEQSGVMKDWILVAAGLERLFFLIYALAFAIVTSVYV